MAEVVYGWLLLAGAKLPERRSSLLFVACTGREKSLGPRRYSLWSFCGNAKTQVREITANKCQYILKKSIHPSMYCISREDAVIRVL